MEQSPDQPQTDPTAEAFAAFQTWTRLFGKAQQLSHEFWMRQKPQVDSTEPDPLGLWSAWAQVAAGLANNPEKLGQMQAQFLKDSVKLWQSFLQPGDGQTAADGNGRDRRFSAPEWQENALFAFVKQSYLLTSDYLMQMVDSVDNIDPKVKAKAEFYTRQFIDAMSPTNFAATNPDVLRKIAETKGQSLLAGFEHLLNDLERGRITMTDEKAFEVGVNVAATPGKVVFENRLFQLIQYTPTTETVHDIPILFFPPWINKFYILDLTEKKSLVRYLLDAGFTVFMTSWVNPDSSLRNATFSDYLIEGELKALEVAAQICNVKAVHTVGYCVAGTALAALLAYLHATKQQAKVASATFLTAQVDFADAGDLGIFVDEQQLDTLERLSEEHGYLDGSYMATTFNMLRANELIWNYVVSNYLLGNDPMQFDLLYWNSDATRLPMAMHLYYLRNMYLKNALVQPGALTVNDTPIDLRKVKTPTYVQAGKEDHIAPARSVIKITKYFKGPLRFILAGSGHIAGVINPPSAQKYQYWTAETLPETIEEFQALATEHKGSWWPDWLNWLKPLSGKQVPARIPGTADLPVIEDAPGRYVKARC